MKKFIPLLAVTVIIAAAAATYILTRSDSLLVTSTEKDPVAQQVVTKDNPTLVDACDFLTQADADALLGAGAKKDETTTDASTEDIKTSNCKYSASASLKSASIKAHISTSKSGAAANKKQFTMELPSATEKVSGVGDAAYWDSALGQLNILKDNNWYIVSIGGLRPTDKTLAEAKTFATRIMSRL